MKQEKKLIQDATLIGDWQEVSALPLSSITKRDTDTQLLDGLVIKGYETKFGKTNENGERYEQGCLDDFIQSYFIDNKLNMVVDVQHGYTIDDQIGRVIYLEANTVGFYFVAYIPRRLPRFGQIKTMLEEGILQGFSKCGWATEYEYRYKENGEFDYMLIRKMDVLSVSLVTAPANAVAFEAIGEAVRNELTYRNRLNDGTKHKKRILKSH